MNEYSLANEYIVVNGLQRIRLLKKVNRNEICPFTNLKFKNCCGLKGLKYCEKIQKMVQEKITDDKDDPVEI